PRALLGLDGLDDRVGSRGRLFYDVQRPVAVRGEDEAVLLVEADRAVPLADGDLRDDGSIDAAERHEELVVAAPAEPLALAVDRQAGRLAAGCQRPTCGDR